MDHRAFTRRSTSLQEHFFSSRVGRFRISSAAVNVVSNCHAGGEAESNGPRTVILSPVPSSDPNEPLNWSTLRKTCNFGLVLAVTCLIFTSLMIQTIFWQLMVEDLGVTYVELNQAMSVNYVGLATGCVFFIPIAKKFGRRPVYLISTALMMVTSFWTANLRSLTELYICNLLSGLAGATNESIAQITIVDLFFVHHRGGINALYMTMVMFGSFLTPMAAGAQATRQGWQASYQAVGICNAILLALFVFFYEETKYSKVIEGVSTTSDDPEQISIKDIKADRKVDIESPANEPENGAADHHELDHTIPMKTWRQRLALWTYTPEPIWPYFYRPFIVLVSFPAVLFCGLQYACGIVWLTVLTSVIALAFPAPLYLFTPEQIGYMSLGPFIGNIIGAFYGGFIGDWSILFFARRNKGYYEPEMRLYILHLPALSLCGGLIMFGVTLSKGMHWIWPSIGGALFGFGVGGIGDAALTLVIDSYMDVTGDAFTGIAFLRNAFSIGIPFAVMPWLERDGMSNMFIACGFISLGITLLTIPMIMYGKQFRRMTEARYRLMAAKQGLRHD
ncbi:putative MFS transporter [Aspergillus clavatus NRRL 1]|uniref:MFS transporter, putative n=1 Tax=Aspergillus clavatus (strain ATCC 1007 / CBS 513.65 / DSM 816 / NCTC 3887 / NRRL 1 / QM 1276 / 107) TaxID=344612 RepID=A1CUH9_ASPCL|nr:MFS transporter, putative [Aspergillus clavatus NRRL 1]EAW06966.1 MFS transporter, putative [Aspergillus clavatus NRRL 1]